MRLSPCWDVHDDDVVYHDVFYQPDYDYNEDDDDDDNLFITMAASTFGDLQVVLSRITALQTLPFLNIINRIVMMMRKIVNMMLMMMIAATTTCPCVGLPI